MHSSKPSTPAQPPTSTIHVDRFQPFQRPVGLDETQHHHEVRLCRSTS